MVHIVFPVSAKAVEWLGLLSVLVKLELYNLNLKIGKENKLQLRT